MSLNISQGHSNKRFKAVYYLRLAREVEDRLGRVVFSIARPAIGILQEQVQVELTDEHKQLEL